MTDKEKLEDPSFLSEVKREDFFPCDEFGKQVRMNDYLVHNRVWVSMWDKSKLSHPDAYGTLVDYGALDRALSILDDNFSPTAGEWEAFVSDTLKNVNFGLAAKAAAIWIASRYEMIDKDPSEWVAEKMEVKK